MAYYDVDPLYQRAGDQRQSNGDRAVPVGHRPPGRPPPQHAMAYRAQQREAEREGGRAAVVRSHSQRNYERRADPRDRHRDHHPHDARSQRDHRGDEPDHRRGPGARPGRRGQPGGSSGDESSLMSLPPIVIRRPRPMTFPQMVGTSVYHLT